MAILKKSKKKKEKKFSYKEHPCKHLDLEIKIHYLNGLALLSNEDDNISSEKKYLLILAESFELDKEIVEESIEFATNPNEEAIFEMIEVLKNQKVKYFFIVDCMILASADNDFNEAEKALIDYDLENLNITKEKVSDLQALFGFIQNKDASSLYEKLKTTTIKKDYVEYAFEYFGIEIDSILSSLELKDIKALENEKNKILKKDFKNDLMHIEKTKDNISSAYFINTTSIGIRCSRCDKIVWSSSCSDPESSKRLGNFCEKCCAIEHKEKEIADKKIQNKVTELEYDFYKKWKVEPNDNTILLALIKLQNSLNQIVSTIDTFNAKMNRINL